MKIPPIRKGWIGTILQVYVLCFLGVSYLIGALYSAILQQDEMLSKLIESNEKLGAQQKELKCFNEIKIKMFSVISHDLRSPYNTILAFIPKIPAQG